MHVHTYMAIASRYIDVMHTHICDIYMQGFSNNQECYSVTVVLPLLLSVCVAGDDDEEEVVRAARLS